MLVFWLELEISGVTVQQIHQNSEKVACSEDFLCGDDLDAAVNNVVDILFFMTMFTASFIYYFFDSEYRVAEC